MEERFTLEGYVVEELIGFGGTGEVWRAHEVATGDEVALKRLRTNGIAATERLRREGALLGSVAGPHVVGVRRMVVQDDRAVLVMDYAAGGSLAAIFGARGALPAPEVVTILAPIAQALAAAHGRDLIHGDLNPANILFTADGRPLLADFGVARAIGATSAAVEGTPDYLDPVVVNGGAISPASDVFALGVVGFVALAGRSPWGSGSPAEVLRRLAVGDRPLLAAVAPEAPAAVILAVESMLALDPDQRPTARAAAHAVLRSSAAAPVRLSRSRPVPPPPPTQVVRLPDPIELEPAAVVRRGGRRGHRAHRAHRASRLGPSVVPTRAKPAGDESACREPATTRASPTPGYRASAGQPSRVGGRAGFVLVAVIALVAAAAAGVGLAHLSGPHVHALAAPGASRLPVTATPAGRSHPVRTPSVPPIAASVGSTSSPWLSVVAHLDATRARAFDQGQPSTLAAVYVPGSSAYAADLATVTSLQSRGLHAAGFTATVDDVTVEASTSTTETLRVVDELSAYSLIDDTGAVMGHGPARPARAFTMQLAKVNGSWRVASVSAVP